MNKIESFLRDMTFHSTFRVLEEGKDADILKEIASKRGIKLPSKDLSVFECIYAYLDRKNKNGCSLPKEEVEKSLDTLVGKAVDIDHLRKKVVGTWIDAKIKNNQIIAYGTFFKSNFPEDFEDIKELMNDGILAVSFEAWGGREFTKGDKEYDLTDIVWAGGALLVKTEPAFDGARVMEMADKKKERILEMAKIMAPPENFLHIKEVKKDLENSYWSPYDINTIYNMLSEIDNLDGENKGMFNILAIDFENYKVKVKDATTNGEMMIDFSPKIAVTKKGKSYMTSKIEDLTAAITIDDFNKFINEFDGSDEQLEIVLEEILQGPKISHSSRFDLTDDDFAIIKSFNTEKNNKKIRLLPILDLAHINNVKDKLETSQVKDILEKLCIAKDSVEKKILRRKNKLKMNELIEKLKKGEISVEEVIQEFAKVVVNRELESAEYEIALSVLSITQYSPGGATSSDVSLLKVPSKKSTASLTSLWNANTMTEEKIKEAIQSATKKVEEAKKAEEEKRVKEEAESKKRTEMAEMDKDKKITKLEEELAKASTIIAEFEKAQKDAKVKARKDELGEFAKDMKDEDLLDDVKFEMAKKDKKIAELEAATKTTSTKKPVDMVKGSADKEVTSEEAKSRQRVNEYAWKRPATSKELEKDNEE